MLRRAILIGVLIVATMPAAANAAGKPGNGCPPGMNLGRMTYAQFVDLPRIQAGIEAGAFTADDVNAGSATIDQNGNGYVCAQLSNGFQQNGPYSQYYYNETDDNSSKGS